MFQSVSMHNKAKQQFQGRTPEHRALRRHRSPLQPFHNGDNGGASPLQPSYCNHTITSISLWAIKSLHLRREKLPKISKVVEKIAKTLFQISDKFRSCYSFFFSRNALESWNRRGFPYLRRSKMWDSGGNFSRQLCFISKAAYDSLFWHY